MVSALLQPAHCFRTAYVITRNSRGGSDALAAAAAALAAASVALNKSRPALAAQALGHARLLYDWAPSAEFYNTSYRGTVVPCSGTAVPMQPTWSSAMQAAASGAAAAAAAVPWVAYPSSSALDDLAWAGMWLHRATGKHKR